MRPTRSPGPTQPNGDNLIIRASLHPLLLITLGALAALTPFAIDLYLPSLPALARDLGSDIRHAQLSVTLYLGFFASAQLLLGPLSDVRGRRPLTGGGLALFALGVLGCALAPSMTWLLVSRSLQAVGGAAIAVTIPALVRDRFARDDYARVMTLVMLVMGLAPLIAPSLGSLVLLVGSWRWVFATLLGITLVTALLFLRVVPETLPPARRQLRFLDPLRQYGRILRHRRALAYLGTASASFAGLMGFVVGSPYVYIELHGISPQVFGPLFGANVALALVVSVLNARLIPRFGAERLLQIGLGVQALAALLMLVLTQVPNPTLWLIAPLTGAYLGMTALVMGNAMAGFMADFPDLAGTASAFGGAVRFGAGALSGSLISLLHDGSATPLLVGMGLSGLMSGSCYLLGARVRETGPE
ncbi:MULTISPECIES: Bcr/CflA family multidrug efflux MFS transporter [Thiorhodovibrio]|uniref:Bcr/CflA family multidrug efflux MFS transporter n=1 Tax=Thiorhodovibrio TaxID=61593 RepID=UPI001F5C58AF|nr:MULTISPECIES: Bcr/CflA family multidrug efflux MFS transporter [Thiorhodovibrio]MBK5968476.1 Bcr/CflA family drug resistance efflux transporter [Thiorhodovibrio winogradskyi]WPL11121.1 Sulfonamide resistance protein [Thiorhodovibrio litoralis]